MAPVGTVSSRFYRWRKAGIWQQILEALQAHADRQGRVDWSLHFIDRAVVRAHQHAAGARKGGRRCDGEALGRSLLHWLTPINITTLFAHKPRTTTAHKQTRATH